VHFEDEGVGCALEDVRLADGVLEVLVFDQEALALDLHGESVALRVGVALEVDFEDLAEGALAESLLDFEGLEGDAHQAVVE